MGGGLYPAGLNIADSGDPEDRTERLLSRFRDYYPVMERFQPLVSGVERRLSQDFPKEPSWRVIAALRRHVLDPRYLRVVAAGGYRYALDGEAREAVSEDHRQYALLRLRELAEEEEEDAGGLALPVFKGARFVLLQQVVHRFGHQIAQQSAERLDTPLSREEVEELSRQVMELPDAEAWLAYLGEVVNRRTV
jgi:hypothetical protein